MWRMHDRCRGCGCERYRRNGDFYRGASEKTIKPANTICERDYNDECIIDSNCRRVF